jgi:hypothetical protein
VSCGTARHFESKERLVLSQIAPFAILLLLENQEFRCTGLFLFRNRRTDGRTDGRTDSSPLNDYVLHKPGTTTKYDNGRGGAKSPHRAVSLFYFRKTKPLFPQITAIIFQHTWKSRSNEHYYTLTIQSAGFPTEPALPSYKFIWGFWLLWYSV